MGCSGSTATGLPQSRPAEKPREVISVANEPAPPTLLQGVAVATVANAIEATSSSSSKSFVQAAALQEIDDGRGMSHMMKAPPPQEPEIEPEADVVTGSSLFPAPRAEESQRPGSLSKSDSGLTPLKPLCPPWRGTYEVPRGFSAELERGFVKGGSSSSGSTSAGAMTPTPSGKASNGSGGSPASSGSPVGARPRNVADIFVSSERPSGALTLEQAARRTKDACPSPFPTAADCRECNNNNCDTFWGKYCNVRPGDVDLNDASTEETRLPLKVVR
eukprot:TRINITY_DN18848_c0_g1_i1.p1 TRINITY_DN18848_c0_g1~~TRINITY_DN18848_c0_g1_i1.p1  ORF type:complete len:275 (-),score=42.95 TRINITY_DN18848_c0_g1_i1:242-1066(-)